MRGVSHMTRKAFYKKFWGLAQKTKHPIFSLAQWSWETNFGENNGTKYYNNLAGIKWVKASPTGKKADGHAYAVYDSFDDFVVDYNRVMSLNAYKDIYYWLDRGNYWEAWGALNTSPYSEADYNQQEMIKRTNEIREADFLESVIEVGNVKSPYAVTDAKDVLAKIDMPTGTNAEKIGVAMLLMGAIAVILLDD